MPSTTRGCERFAVRVHAFVLMDNHVHLLVSADKAGAVSSTMRPSGQSYVQAFNVRHRRSGTLWLGGSSPAWNRPNSMCSLPCATKSGTRPHGGTANRVPLVKRAHASGAREKPTHHAAQGLGCDVAERLSVYASGFMRV